MLSEISDRVAYRSAEDYGQRMLARQASLVSVFDLPIVLRTAENIEQDGHLLEPYERIITGYASVTGKPYKMVDAFGEYSETIARGAFIKSLRTSPNVAHRIEHQGLGLSSTSSGTLDLVEDETGLKFISRVDTRETDAADLVNKLERGVASQTSFAFRLEAYEWDESFENLTISEVNLDRGDVASCCYGANPNGTHTVALPATSETQGLSETFISGAPSDAEKELDERQKWATKMLAQVDINNYDLIKLGAE